MHTPDGVRISNEGRAPNKGLEFDGEKGRITNLFIKLGVKVMLCNLL